MGLGGTTRTIVVKIGGSTLGVHDTSVADIAELHRQGERIVVVHGGGPAISSWLKKLQTPTQFVRGLRVTDAAGLEVVTAVLAGLVNKQLVASFLSLGAAATGVSGADGGMLLAGYEDETLGYVGRVTRVDTALLQTLLAAGYLPVVAPLALLESEAGTASGQLLNVNADTVAGQLAGALQAERLVFLTDVEGVRGATGETLRRASAVEVQALLDGGVIVGGMIPKVEAGLLARAGGGSVVILDGRAAHRLQAALSKQPPGTLLQ